MNQTEMPQAARPLTPEEIDAQTQAQIDAIDEQIVALQEDRAAINEQIKVRRADRAAFVRRLPRKPRTPKATK